MTKMSLEIQGPVPTSGFPVESSWSLVLRSRRVLVRMLSLSLPLLEPLSTWAFHSLYSSNGEQRRNLKGSKATESQSNEIILFVWYFSHPLAIIRAITPDKWGKWIHANSPWIDYNWIIWRLSFASFCDHTSNPFSSYLSSEYMSSRLFWMGVPVTAQRARALSWHTAMEVCTLGFLMLWASSRTTRAQATRRRGAERGGWGKQREMKCTCEILSMDYKYSHLTGSVSCYTIEAEVLLCVMNKYFSPRHQNLCWVSQPPPSGLGSL